MAIVTDWKKTKHALQGQKHHMVNAFAPTGRHS